MKLYVITIAIVGLITSTISAPALSLGVGMNTSSIAGQDSTGNSSSIRLGYTLNVGFEQPFSERFTFRTGVSLETRGESNVRTVTPDPSYTEEKKEVLEILNLQIPMLAQVNFPLGNFGINVFGGPELGVFISSERRGENTSNFPAEGGNPPRSATAYDTTDFSSDMKMLDFGFRIGVGFELNAGDFGAFFFRPSAYIGAIDILQTGYEKVNNANLNGKHQAYSFAFGFKFNINPKMYSAAPASETVSEGDDLE